MRRPTASTCAVSVGTCAAAVPGPAATSEVAAATAGEAGPAAAPGADATATPVAAGGITCPSIGTGADPDPRESGPGSVTPVDPGRKVGATSAAAQDPVTAASVAAERAQPARAGHTSPRASVTGGRGTPPVRAATSASTCRAGATIAA